MTLKRDLAWKHLDLVNRSSVAYQYARYASSKSIFCETRFGIKFGRLFVS